MIDPTLLSDRISAATGPSRELDVKIAKAIGAEHGPREIVYYASRSVTYIDEQALIYTASVDAAMKLIPDGWFTFYAAESKHNGSWRWELRKRACDTVSARAATPALAICAASMRARGL